ncbi:unnamed protein product [Cyclocybe aegerita]|uniref:Uncharacterized protein n=1 Tax=Cyclocybe aegerita TaxID=1973307 RepID=A0A8S0VSN9_CYCAE|nr:unnamed protein product [Cyclocybe aegerita]
MTKAPGVVIRRFRVAVLTHPFSFILLLSHLANVLSPSPMPPRPRSPTCARPHPSELLSPWLPHLVFPALVLPPSLPVPSIPSSLIPIPLLPAPVLPAPSLLSSCILRPSSHACLPPSLPHPPGPEPQLPTATTTTTAPSSNRPRQPSGLNININTTTNFRIRRRAFGARTDGGRACAAGFTADYPQSTGEARKYPTWSLGLRSVRMVLM